MSLMYARYPYPEPIARAVQMVMSRQLPVIDIFMLNLRVATNNVYLGRIMGPGGHRGCF